MNRAFVVGLFVLAGLGLFATGLFMIGNRHQTFAKHVEFYSEFADLSEIAKGAKVEVAGMDAGEVVAVLVPDSPSSKFRVTMRINQTLRGLVRTDSVVTVGTEGVVGNKFLSIGGGSPQAPAAPANATLASREPTEISALLDQAKGTIADVDVTVRNANSVVTTANGLLTSVGGNLNAALVTARTTLSNANEVVAGIKEGQGTAGMLLHDPVFADRVRMSLTNVQKTTAEIQHAAETANAVVADIHSQEFPRKIDDTLGQVKEAAANLNATSQTMRATVTELAAPDEKGLTVAVNLRQSLSSLNTAAGNIAEDSEALKHNFLLRSFFKKRGYYDLTHLAADRYRNERIFVARGNGRLWLSAAELFERDSTGAESLSPAGASLLQRVVSQFGAKVLESAIVIEGYSDALEASARILSSQNRSLIVRNRMQNIFQLDPETIGSVALESTPPKDAGRTTWDGVAIVIVPPK